MLRYFKRQGFQVEAALSQVKGKGGKSNGAPFTPQSGGKGICFEWRDTGKCQRPGCIYDHPQDQRGVGNGGGCGKGGGKSKSKGKGKGKNGEGKGGATGNADKPAAPTESMKHKLCKYTRNPELGACPLGKRKCPFNHNKAKWEKKYGKSAGDPNAKAKA